MVAGSSDKAEIPSMIDRINEAMWVTGILHHSNIVYQDVIAMYCDNKSGIYNSQTLCNVSGKNMKVLTGTHQREDR